MRHEVVPPQLIQSPGDLPITHRESKWTQHIVVCTFDCNGRRIRTRKEDEAELSVRGDPAFLSCDAKRKESLMSHDQQDQQGQQGRHHPQHMHTFQLLEGSGSLPSTPQEQSKAILWRQRMKLEFELQGHIIRTTTLVQEWQRLHGCKEAVGNEVSTLAGRILLTGFVGLQQERESWYQSYEQDDLAQKERRIQQDMLRCSMDIATCKAKIIRLDFELALL